MAHNNGGPYTKPNGKFTITGQVLWNGQITVSNPRWHGQIYNIGSIVEEEDPFDKWAREVRQINEQLESINGS